MYISKKQHKNAQKNLSAYKVKYFITLFNDENVSNLYTNKDKARMNGK